MSSIQNLNVKLHQQDDAQYCGAASLMMVLASIGVPAESLSQDDLFNEAHSHSISDITVPWAAAPDGIIWSLGFRNPDYEKYLFVLHAESSADILSRCLVHTIGHYKVAPIALVFDMQHWIVVSGYNISQEPTRIDDTSYYIWGFWIKNPWPLTPRHVSGMIPPPPHSAGDPCGDGESGRGDSDDYIDYYSWITSYMTGVAEGKWAGRFVAICDPTPAPKSPGLRVPLKYYFDGEKLLDSKTAGEQAMLGLKSHGLLTYEPLEKMLENVQPGGDVVLVHRLDRENSFYYMVPLYNHSNEMQALVSVDARFGHFMQASFASQKRSMIFKLLSRDEILKILGKRLKMENENKVLVIHPEVVSIYPCLVWKPCRESLSMHIPFYMITVQEYKIWVRLDGVIFPHLNFDGKGI